LQQTDLPTLPSSAMQRLSTVFISGKSDLTISFGMFTASERSRLNTGQDHLKQQQAPHDLQSKSSTCSMLQVEIQGLRLPSLRMAQDEKCWIF
jgi:hypothetical protein